MNIFPKVVIELITELKKLPGIGNKSAAKLTYYFLKTPKDDLDKIANIFLKIKNEIKTCEVCCNFSDEEMCSVCKNPEREKNEILVVEDPLDTAAFEEIGIYKGMYHVLGGKLSPVEGIGPEDLTIDELEKRIKELMKEKYQNIEIIFATTPDLAGEATLTYIKERLGNIKNVTFTSLARGLPTGADLGYADSKTLENALEDRKQIS
ncbi:recombination protein RecR [Candidatus Dojkabacteria bacterium]|nr:recombination protein RecR [Candidatus Dojkabacteria bacterium]